MPPGRRVFVLLYTASGAAALVYEVAWTRLFALQLGHTVAAASTVLAAFMGGLAAGAWIAGRWMSDGGPERAAPHAESLMLDGGPERAVPHAERLIVPGGPERAAPQQSERSWRGPFRAADRLHQYAALELTVAAAALLLPTLLHATTPALAWAYADGSGPARFAIARVGISLALLGIPAAAMGATFPIAAEWFADAAVLYAANSVGAAIGAVAAGFWLVPVLGLRGTSWVGVALNVVAAGGAIVLAGRGTRPTAERAELTEARSKKIKKRSLRVPRLQRLAPLASPGVAYTAAAVSGFAALVYEVAWTRLLALVIGPTTYAFATMAAAFIGGLALGSAIASRVASRLQRPALWLCAALIVGAVAAMASAWYAATQLPLSIAAQVADDTASFSRIVVWQALAVALLLLPMTLALGAAFPFALAAAGAPEGHVGAGAARVYAANTAGAIVGALAAGFVLIPQLGMRATFQFTAAFTVIAAAIAAVRALRGAESAAPHDRPAEAGPHRHGGVPHDRAAEAAHPRRGAALTIAVAGVALVAIFALPSWDRELLASGAYKYAPYLSGGDFDTVLRAGRIEYYKEGAAGTVSVRRLTGTLSLAIDGKVDASNGGDMLTQRMLGLLPAILHGHANDICIIGLGSGVTVDAALAAGTVRSADVVEISPEVVEASHFFDEENGRALTRQGVRLILGDGRSHLLLTPRTYDVIVSEPSNPWMAGVASLFTREFFEAARSRLRPDGLLCQWAHTYDISPADLQSIVRTFASVFPQGSMWLIGEGDLLLIGTRGAAIAPVIDRLPRAWRPGTASAALTPLGITDGAAAFAILSMFAGGPAELERFGDDAVLQTDDRTALEYSAPRAIYGRTIADNAAAIRNLGAQPPPSVTKLLDGGTDAQWTSRGTMLLKAEAFGLAYDAFKKAVIRNTANATALAGLSDAAAGMRSGNDERELLTSIAAREPGNAPVRIELSRVLASSGNFEAAVTAATEALRIAPDDGRAAEQLASVLADAGDGERLAQVSENLLARFPNRPDTHYYRGTALFMGGKAEDALAEARRVLAVDPRHARAQNLLGAACATLGRRDCAEAAFEASIDANPRDSSTYVNLGMLRLQSGNPHGAADAFAEALALSPSSDAARTGLAQARAQLAR